MALWGQALWGRTVVFNYKISYIKYHICSNFTCLFIERLGLQLIHINRLIQMRAFGRKGPNLRFILSAILQS